MSYGSQYHIIQKNENPTLTWRVELAKKGYTGDSDKLEGDKDAGSFVLEYESLDADNIFAAQKSRLEMYIVVRNSSDRSILETVFGADDDEYRLRLKLDGTIVWEGAVLTDQLELPTDAFRRGVFIAKDISRIGASEYPLTTGRDTIINVLASLLDDTGMSKDIKTIPSFSNANTSDSDDWMNQISLDRRRIRTFADSQDEADQPKEVMETLQTLCRNFGIIIRQSEGDWYIAQLTGQANDPATEYTYNSSGTQQSSSSVDFDAAVDKVNRWLTPEGRTVGTPGIKEVTVEYKHNSRSQIQTIPDRVAITENEANQSFITAPFFSSDGTQRIAFDCGVEADAQGTETSITARIEFRVGDTGNYYYLNNPEDGELEWIQTQTDFEIDLDDFSGGPDGPGISQDENTSDSSGVWFRARPVSSETPQIPSGADGDIQVTFRGALATFDDGDPDSIVSETRYYHIKFSLKNTSASADSKSLSYSLTQTGDVSGEYDIGETWFGDGPARYSVGALSYSGGITNDDWRRVGGTAEIKYHKLLMRDILDTQREAVKVEEAELLGDYSPHQILTKNSGNDRYFFLEGRLTGSEGIWSARLLKLSVDTAGDDDLGEIIDDPDDGTGSGTGGGGGGGGEDPQAVGELTADVSGKPTSIPIECYTGKSIETGKDYYVKNLVKNTNNYFTATETVDSGTHDLSIQEDVIVAPNGSKIYKDEGQKETERVIQVEAQNATESARAALSVSVREEREATSIGTTTSELSGSGVTSIPVEGIPFEVKLDDGDVLTLLDVVDSAEGANADVTVNGNQTLSAGTGTVTINSKTFSHTFPVGSSLFEPAAGLTARVTATARVVSDNSTNIATIEAKADANSAQVVLKAESTSGEITKLALVRLDSSIAGGSAITLAADQINISGNTTFTSGYDPSDGRTTIRATSAPSQRPSGDPLVDGDIWLDTNDGNKPYSWNGSSWIADYTNIDGGNITTGAIQSGNFSAGSTGWQIDTNGDAEFNTVTIRDGTIINPTFSGAAVGLINTVATFGDLPASGGDDGDTYYVEDEPGGLYVWRDSDSEWKNTRDGQFLLADTVVASKINVATLSAITADIGAANISDTLTMGASGEITNSNGDYTIDADGFSLTIGGSSAQTIEWLSGTTIYGSVNTSAAGELTLIGWDGSQRNIGITVGDGILNKLNTEFESGVNVSGGNVIVPDSTSATHALNTQSADGRYILDGTVSAGSGLGTPDLTVRIEVDGQLVDIEAFSV